MINYEEMDNSFYFVPHHMRDGFKLWIEEGILPGSFGTAVLENDLKNALGKADKQNRRCLFSIVAWFWNFAPSDCWGSIENVKNWKGINNDN